MEQFAQILTKTAESLGLEAARIWPQVVTITWFNGIFRSIVNPLLVIISLLVTRKTYFWYRATRKQEPYDDDEIPAMFALIGMTCLAVFITIGVLVSTPGNWADVLYPEARTVMRLIGK